MQLFLTYEMHNVYLPLRGKQGVFSIKKFPQVSLYLAKRDIKALCFDTCAYLLCFEKFIVNLESISPFTMVFVALIYKSNLKRTLSSQGVNGSCRSVGRFTVYKKRTIQSYKSQVKRFKANIYSFLTFDIHLLFSSDTAMQRTLNCLFVLLMKVCTVKSRVLTRLVQKYMKAFSDCI